ncbi:MAG: lysophospholipid acyltransferase family protein [Promethearchaeota archaeon]
MSEKESANKKSNPILDVVDKALVGIRKFLSEQKLLNFTDEFSYLILRKSLELLKNTFVPMKIEGTENIPIFKPAILCSIAKQPIDLFIVTALTPRKVHLMIPWKFFETPGLKPILEAFAAFRSTKSKDDMEPVQNVIKFLNQDKDLVGMIPLDEDDDEMLQKQFAGILKFAAGIPCPVIPYASTSLKHYKFGDKIRVKVGEPMEVDPKIKRDDRYALASDIITTIRKLHESLVEHE